MPLCADCKINDGALNIMIQQGEETFKGKAYAVLVCTMGCGSSIRVPLASTELIRGCAFCGTKKKIKDLYLKSSLHRYFCDRECEKKFKKRMRVKRSG